MLEVLEGDVKKKIVIQVSDSRVVAIGVEVDAQVATFWAAHQRRFHLREWVVTHVPTGLRLPEEVVGILSDRDAKRILRRLASSGWDPTDGHKGSRYVCQALVAEALDGTVRS